MSAFAPRVTVACLVALCATGCFRFDERLAACRSDAGAWLCGDAGAGDGGGAVVGPRFGYGDLHCFSDGGWCWEHPRPAGGRYRSVLARAPNDLWFGTDQGLVLHLDDAGWRTEAFLGPFFAVTALCGRPGSIGVYAGADLQAAASDARVFSLGAGAATAIAGSDDDVSAMACADDRVWIAHSGGLWSLPWGGAAVAPSFVADASERVVGVTSTGPGTALAVTGPRTATTFVNVKDQAGALQVTFTPDAAQEENFTAADIWTTSGGDVQLALNGRTQGAVWRLDAGSWFEVYPNSPLPQPLFADGTAWRAGALAVGSGGLILELEGDVVTERIVPSSGSSFHDSAAGLPSGEAWVTGEPGCVLARDRDGGWALLTECERFVDFSVGREVVAISADALYARSTSGWVREREGLSGLCGVWTNPDGGGRAVLSDDRLEYRSRELDGVIAMARALTVLDEERVVVTLDDGTVLDTNLGTGGDAGTALLARGARVVVDRQTRTFWALGRLDPNDPATTRLWRSSRPGEWEQVDAGEDVFADDLAVGFGRVWLVAQNSVLYRRADGAWGRVRRTGASFSRAIVLDDTRALVGQYAGPAYLVDSTTNATTEFDHLPFDAARVEVAGDDVWLLGVEGLLRRPVPPR